jgi:hypothetical protein
MDPDPDPGGPKTRGSGGSGSATLGEIIEKVRFRYRDIRTVPLAGYIDPRTGY